MDDLVADDFCVEPANEVDHILLTRLCEYIDERDPWLDLLHYLRGDTDEKPEE